VRCECTFGCWKGVIEWTPCFWNSKCTTTVLSVNRVFNGTVLQCASTITSSRFACWTWFSWRPTSTNRQRTIKTSVPQSLLLWVSCYNRLIILIFYCNGRQMSIQHLLFTLCCLLPVESTFWLLEGRLQWSCILHDSGARESATVEWRPTCLIVPTI